MPHTLGCTTRPYSSVDFSTACRHIADAGYTDVALFGNSDGPAVGSDSPPDYVAERRRIANDAGLTPSMVIGGMKVAEGVEAAASDYFKLIDAVAAVGGTFLLDCGTDDTERIDDYLAVMRRAAAHAASVGVQITMKPHGGITLTVEHLTKIHEAVDHPAFGICFDPGNIIYYTKGKRRPEPDAPAIASRTNSAIIKDCIVEGDTPEVWVNPGEGLVDFPAVLGGLVAGGFTGPLYLECVAQGTIEQVNRHAAAARGFVATILEEG